MTFASEWVFAFTLGPIPASYIAGAVDEQLSRFTPRTRGSAEAIRSPAGHAHPVPYWRSPRPRSRDHLTKPSQAPSRSRQEPQASPRAIDPQRARALAASRRGGG